MPHNLSQNKAIQQYDAAFHLLHVTFPLVQDPKLIMGIINNLNQSLEAVMDTILTYERQLKLVPAYSEEFNSKFNLFRYKCVKRNNIPTKFIMAMMELRELEELHKKCPVSFQRGNRYVLSTNNYRLKAVSIKDIKEYLNITKDFINHLPKIIKF
jgi:hypothetical protein